MRRSPHLRAAVLALALLALLKHTTAAPPPPQRPTMPAGAAATVNGEVIPEKAVQRALNRVPLARRAESRTKLIDYLVDNLLIDQSLRASKHKVEKGEVDQRVNEMKAELKKIGKDFDKMLAEIQTSEAELRTHIEADLRWFKYADSHADDKVIRHLFKTEKDLFDGSAVRARHILIEAKDPKDAKAAVKQLKELKKKIEVEVDAGLAKLPATASKEDREKARGELINDAFARHAKANSACPTKDKGGDVSWFQKVGDMVAPFSEAAFKLQPNQMSEPVQTPFGYHLILVTERKPGKDVKLEDVKEAVREVYFERLRIGLAAKLRQKAIIRIASAP
jgi:parvulin-like peptidyl-prolyl isomerase